jgi:DegV family protein with EDD domain
VVAIVTDSAANLPDDLARQLGIEVVPMYLKFGDRVYSDGRDLTPDDFYDRLVEEAETASTSSPSPGDFLDAYRRSGDGEVVCVTVASSMSAAHQEATLAAERFEGRVTVVDSKSASMAEGFVAAEAARLARAGETQGEVARVSADLADRTTLIAVVNTFEFLRRSGRVTKLQAYAATMLDIKPMFRFQRGEVSPVARPRTRRRALDRLVTETLQEVGDRPVHLATFHASAEDDAGDVASRIASQAEVVERMTVAVTPVIGAHTGPGLVGAAFYCD